jgi:hypothetical protein
MFCILGRKEHEHLNYIGIKYKRTIEMKTALYVRIKLLKTYRSYLCSVLTIAPTFFGQSTGERNTLITLYNNTVTHASPFGALG